ncbi:MAG: lipase [Leptolyngbya sp.]|nr:MAG: lipase [Leptolyngbya sp.]
MIWVVNFSCASMTKLTRRKVLLTGLVAGTASAIAAQHPTQAADPPRTPVKNDREPTRPSALFDYDGDPNSPPTVENGLVEPPIPYDRTLSKLLIQCCDIAYDQFATGIANPAYDGSIKSLKSYTPLLDGYTQVASFKARDELLGISLQGTVIPEILRQLPLDEIERRLPQEIRDRLPRVLQRVANPRMVFLGFALTSKQGSIIVFRGSQTSDDWITNLQIGQADYVRAGVPAGKVHRGFLSFYSNVQAQVQAATKLLNPAAPCYLTGHSLGGALATFATSDLSLSKLKPQLRLYTYASPRVGNLGFAEYLSGAVPNLYRIFNLADSVPEVPPSKTRNSEFHHVGQNWSFLYYTGDVAPNHFTSVYRAAIAKQIEINKLPDFPV